MADLILRAKRNSLQQLSQQMFREKKSQEGDIHILQKNVAKGLKPEVIKQNTIGHMCVGYTHIV